MILETAAILLERARSCRTPALLPIAVEIFPLPGDSVRYRAAPKLHGRSKLGKRRLASQAQVPKRARFWRAGVEAQTILSPSSAIILEAAPRSCFALPKCPRSGGRPPPTEPVALPKTPWGHRWEWLRRCLSRT